MNANTTNCSNPSALFEMPSVEWFASLPTKRRFAALRGTGQWSLCQEADKSKLYLSLHKGESMLEPKNLKNADEPIREILTAVPKELHGALVVVTEATVVSHMNRLKVALGAICGDAVKAAEVKHEAIAAYLDGPLERHVLFDNHTREELWKQAMAAAATDGVRQSLASKWRQLVRAEYLLRALKAHVRFEY